MIWRWLGLLCRLVLGGVFLYSAATKVLDPAGFARSVAAYVVVPQGLVWPLAYFLPWLELLVGLGLITGLALKGSALWANLLLLAFMAGLSANILAGSQAECGCFGVGGSHTPAEALKRDLLLLPLSLGCLWAGFRSRRE